MYYPLQDKDDASWGPNNKFRFPLHGGTGAIYEGLYKAVPQKHFKFNASVVHIDADKKVLKLADGASLVVIEPRVSLTEPCGSGTAWDFPMRIAPSSEWTVLLYTFSACVARQAARWPTTR